MKLRDVVANRIAGITDERAKVRISVHAFHKHVHTELIGEAFDLRSRKGKIVEERDGSPIRQRTKRLFKRRYNISLLEVTSKGLVGRLRMSW
jgi:hypothetical protein